MAALVNIHNMLCIKIGTQQQVLPICERKEYGGIGKFLGQCKCIQSMLPISSNSLRNVSKSFFFFFLCANHCNVQISIKQIELLRKDNELSRNKDCKSSFLLAFFVCISHLELSTVLCS